MKKYLILTTVFTTVCLFGSLLAYVPEDVERERIQNKDRAERIAQYRSDCAQATAEVDLDVNNVRARLLAGGDMWWDLSEAKYIVPNVRPPQPEVSAIFAGSVWIGGFDDEGNLKMAGQDYRTSGVEWWPGPLTPGTGETFAQRCLEWDRFFRVTSADIEEHKRNIRNFIEQGQDYPPELIPDNVKYWPALGNPFFNERYDFELPFNDQGLGNFFDFTCSGVYDPSQGDYPIIEIRGCVPECSDRDALDLRDPDEMYFWVYNDAGGVHTNSGGDVIRMEVQVQAFAYATQDEINNMTFYRHKLINRAPTSIDSTYFSMWVDADLGCPFDDYIGSDSTLDLMYQYNEDAVDGSVPGSCECPTASGPIPTYCRDIPALGVDYFRGPLDENGEEIGLSSFMYYNNPSGFDGSAATTDPGVAGEFYNYLTAHWRDGRPLTVGGSGYRVTGGTPTNYAFTDEPNDLDGWSMCTAGLNQADRRTLQTSGPFRLDPGAINELIVGVVWVPEIVHPCPDLSRLFSADRTAQALFDNCFDFPRGPDAPDMFPIELDQEIIFTLVNDSILSNNAFLQYAEKGLQIPDGEQDSLYVFEGYQVFQLRNAATEATRASFEDIDRARLVFQTDLRNEISSIFNWNPVDDPNSNDAIFVPQQMVAGSNQGLRHSFRVDEDLFADGDRALINHKKYYYAVIAYGFNDFETFNWRNPESGQPEPYLEGGRNVRIYTVTPRPTVYKNLNADYGDGVPITRIQGQGSGRNFLEIDEDVRESIANGTFDGEMRFAPGGGPVEIFVYNPLDVVDGEYELRFTDDEPESDELADDATWVVTNLETGEQVESETGIDILNEHLVGKFGFSVTIGQVPLVGTQPFSVEDNGFLGGIVDYEDPNGVEWLDFIRDEGPAFAGGLFDMVKTELDADDFDKDPERSFVVNNETGFYPYCLIDYRPGNQPLLTPAWVTTGNNPCSGAGAGVPNSNNVDIVFTSDKSQWSRSIIVEAANPTFIATGLHYLDGITQLDLLDRPAASKEAGPDGMPLDDPSLENGFGWFPGYAVDVETGKRLNIFFAENTIYGDQNPLPLINQLDEELLNGNDRMWNPTDELVIEELLDFGVPGFYAGGQHFVYVTRQEYDGCEQLHDIFTTPGVPSNFIKQAVLRNVAWAGVPLATDLLSYEEGLIPNDAIVKLRVATPYDVDETDGDEKAYNTYRFTIDGLEADDLIEEEFDNALDQILVVPNPYYAYSQFEENQFDNNVRITNLPDQATVTIYTLDGKFIRRYMRNTGRALQASVHSPPTEGRLPTSGLNWDLKNSAGIPVASGIYLIHVEAPGLGERVIKWFGVAREFDPSGL